MPFLRQIEFFQTRVPICLKLQMLTPRVNKTVFLQERFLGGLFYQLPT